MGAALPSYPFPQPGESREGAPGSPLAGDFNAWIIGRSGGYRNLAVRGKKGGGRSRRADGLIGQAVAESHDLRRGLRACQARATMSRANSRTAMSRAGGE